MKEAKVVTKVRKLLMPNQLGPNQWQVHYLGRDGKEYWKRVKADNELEAYMKVMGIKKGAN